LLVIDEEQKFGVAVKDKLKQIKSNVDTLTMSATPIPRTLQFSLMGARDLSAITTPPPNRHPIQTEVHPFNEEIIKEAIEFELSRNGQVFFVNNRISVLSELEVLIHKLVPDARVIIGHGQMEPEKLERVILDYADHEYDVLLSTTIIEAGVDMPNTNTIIINEAQNFGLSDLHQLRGRVGRSNKKAFCYLLTPPYSVLKTDARRRLQAIENFSELGSGIHIAMQDLDIRGAGNLLGSEQSGFITDLGYETYQKILKEAVSELKTEEFSDLYEEEKNRNDNFVEECIIETDMELLFPASYIENESERILLYQELDNMEREEDIAKFKLKLEDRFGRIPKQGIELISVVTLRRLAKLLGMEKVTLKQGKMNLYFISDEKSNYFESDTFGKIIEYVQREPKRAALRENRGKRILTIGYIDSVAMGIEILERII
ncbi:MAG: transcription-repair coupling factor, partial [Bacteroidales bacterium]|nr:transcription-repair coupling factor [Bacteroidales bacterium]